MTLVEIFNLQNSLKLNFDINHSILLNSDFHCVCLECGSFGVFSKSSSFCLAWNFSCHHTPKHFSTLQKSSFFRLNGAAFVLFKRPIICICNICIVQKTHYAIFTVLSFDICCFLVVFVFLFGIICIRIGYYSNNLSIAFAMRNLRIFNLQLFFYRKKTKKIWIAWQRGKRKLLEKEMSSPHDFWSPTLSDNPTFLHIGIHSTTFQGDVEEKWRWKNWHRFMWHLDITCCQYQYLLHVFCN